MILLKVAIANNSCFVTVSCLIMDSNFKIMYTMVVMIWQCFVLRTYRSTIKFVPECIMTQEMCNKAVNRCFFVFGSIPDQYKIREMCDRIVSEDSFFIVYCLDRYKTQKMCDEAVDDSLATVKLIPDWFVTSTIKKLFTAL